MKVKKIIAFYLMPDGTTGLEIEVDEDGQDQIMHVPGSILSEDQIQQLTDRRVERHLCMWCGYPGTRNFDRILYMDKDFDAYQCSGPERHTFFVVKKKQ